MADDALAHLNDHLGRFLRQADELLDEIHVRLTVDTEHLGAAVAGSLDRAGDKIADRAAGRLVGRLTEVTAELDQVTAAARRARRSLELDRRRGKVLAIGALAAALVADVLLFLLLVRSPDTSARGAWHRPDTPVTPAPSSVAPAQGAWHQPDTPGAPDAPAEGARHLSDTPDAPPRDGGVAEGAADAAVVAPEPAPVTPTPKPKPKPPPKRKGK